MFIYGSILIAVTLRPVVLSKRPVDDAERRGQSGTSGGYDSRITYNAFADAADDSSRYQDIFGHRVVEVSEVSKVTKGQMKRVEKITSSASFARVAYFISAPLNRSVDVSTSQSRRLQGYRKGRFGDLKHPRTRGKSDIPDH